LDVATPRASRLRWYAARASTMPPGEWLHRGRSAIAIARERRAGARPAWIARGVEGWPRPAAAVPLVTDADVERVRRIPGTIEAARAAAAAVADGRVEFFGHGEVSLGRELDWHHDPTSGHDWPRVHWSRIDHRAAGGDPKWIWELGRHQHVVLLARAWRVTGDDRFAHAAADHLETFLDQSPPAIGIHWRVGLEVGVRLISWAWTVELMRASPASSAGLHGRLLESVAAHLRHLRRYPSLHSSANNHRIGELAGAAVGGLAFPDVPGAASIAETALAELGAELERQVYADGVDAELSPAYQGFVLDLVLCVVACLVRLGREVPAAIAGRTAGLAEVLACMASDSGTLPRIGDDDDAVGVDLASPMTLPERLASRLRTTTILLDHPLSRSVRGMDEQTAWLCGPLAEAPVPEERLPGSVSFPVGGFAILRHRDDRGREVRAVLKAGPFGLGPLYAHGHADLLSLCLSVWGEEAVVDPGPVTYFGDMRWRDWARSTAAHSTLRVGGREQAVPSGRFIWRKPPRAYLDPMRDEGGALTVEAHHAAYAPVRHHRRVEMVEGDVTVIDRLSGPPGRRRVDLRWNLAPGEVREARDEWLWDGSRAGLRIAVEGLGPVRAVTGCESRPLGFVSYRLEHREPAPTLVAEGVVELPARIVSRLSPRAPADG
jgi:hypothetical protein